MIYKFNRKTKRLQNSRGEYITSLKSKRLWIFEVDKYTIITGIIKWNWTDYNKLRAEIEKYTKVNYGILDNSMHDEFGFLAHNVRLFLTSYGYIAECKEWLEDENHQDIDNKNTIVWVDRDNVKIDMLKTNEISFFRTYNDM
jgi:hypothetical protein